MPDQFFTSALDRDSALDEQSGRFTAPDESGQGSNRSPLPDAEPASGRFSEEREVERPVERVADHEPDAPVVPHRRIEPAVRFYIALWLPASGALIAYAVMHRSFWAGLVGAELLAVGWFTLARLEL